MEVEKVAVDVYVKWTKNEAFDRYHLNWKKERIDKLYNILYLYRKENIIENFYMYETFYMREDLRSENNE